MGNCSFCGAAYTQTWPVSVAVGFVQQIVQAYEPDDRPEGSPQPLHIRLKTDWDLFGPLDSARTRALVNALAPRPAGSSSPGVRLRAVDEVDGDEMVASWRRFSAELRGVNRWFPSEREAVAETLGRLVPSHTVPLSAPLILYRARVCLSSDNFGVDDMGKPPAHLARAGRANPSGIPYLYTASTTETAIKECRPVHNGIVSVAAFATGREISVLDLTSTAPADPFASALTSPEGWTWESYALAVISYQLRRVIGDELSRPVRPGEGEPDYASTQFLCEYAKARGCDGVRYGSAVDPGNWNLVLFEDGHIECRSIDRYEITGVEVTTRLEGR